MNEVKEVKKGLEKWEDALHFSNYEQAEKFMAWLEKRRDDDRSYLFGEINKLVTEIDSTNNLKECWVKFKIGLEKLEKACEPQ